MKIWFLIRLTSFAVRYVGKLVGRYHDSQGNPTKYLKGVESKAKRGAQLEEKQKIEEAKIPSCNSKWSQEEGGEVLPACLTIIIKQFQGYFSSMICEI